jgi:pSer/pThr/pTyr-binding forkhead associated (FHA) protein
MSQPARPGQPEIPVNRSGTLIETEDEVRQAILSGLKGQQQLAPAPAARPAPPQAPAPPPQPHQQPPVPAAAPIQTVSPYRPTSRPPFPVLTIFDDGKNEGEVVRIRDQRFVIGRTEGDLHIPLDSRISSRHVEITLQTLGAMHRWVVTDLQSMHGMFVRVSRSVLPDRAEFLVGNGRYRFETPQALAEATTDEAADSAGFGQTGGWTDGASPFRAPAVTELFGNEIGNRTLLVKPEYWIGSDPTCQICRPDDPFCEPRHVHLFRGSKGAWHAEHNKTLNGLWVRMTQIVVESTVRFQIGEQRFQLKV